MKILISVVTFNRLKLLKKLVNSLRNQTYVTKDILVVNNSSTDGTIEWLQAQTDIKVIQQSNTGSSGGQYTALKYAVDNNYDFIWAMDDDVLPEKECLEELVKNASNTDIIFPLRFQKNGEVFLNEAKYYNFRNPFKSLWKELINAEDVLQTKIEVEGPTFEGAFIPVKIIQEVGLPDISFFIFADDTEYFLRMRKHGYNSFLICSAHLNRQLPTPKNEITFDWKSYYSFRNLIILDVLYGNLPVRFIRPLFYFLMFLARAKNFKNIQTVLSSFVDGYFYKQNLI